VAAITVRVAFTLAVIAAALTVGAGFLEVASRVRAGISVPPGKTASRDRVDPAEDSGHEVRGPTSAAPAQTAGARFAIPRMIWQRNRREARARLPCPLR
jgi:hypothetical protein